MASGLRILVLLLFFTCRISATADPAFDLTSKPPRVNGFPVGTKIVWMAMVRERGEDQSHMTILRGQQTIDASGKLEVDRIDRDFTRSLWLLASVDGSAFVRGAASGYEPTEEPLPVVAEKGKDRLTIRAQSIHLTWLAGKDVWIFAGADGGARDEDGQQNGIIVVRLASMAPLRGKSAPPASLSAGDRFLLIDPEENRIAVTAVTE